MLAKIVRSAVSEWTRVPDHVRQDNKTNVPKRLTSSHPDEIQTLLDKVTETGKHDMERWRGGKRHRESRRAHGSWLPSFSGHSSFAFIGLLSWDVGGGLLYTTGSSARTSACSSSWPTEVPFEDREERLPSSDDVVCKKC